MDIAADKMLTDLWIPGELWAWLLGGGLGICAELQIDGNSDLDMRKRGVEDLHRHKKPIKRNKKALMWK